MEILIISMLLMAIVLYFRNNSKKRREGEVLQILDAASHINNYKKRMEVFCRSVRIDPDKGGFIFNSCAFININMSAVLDEMGLFINESEPENKLIADEIHEVSSVIMMVQASHMLTAESHPRIDQEAKNRRSEILEKSVLTTLFLDSDNSEDDYARIMQISKKIIESLKSKELHLLQNCYDSWAELFLNSNEDSLKRLGIAYRRIIEFCRAEYCAAG